MIVLAALIGLLLLAVVLSPFVLGSGGQLAEASAIDSLPRLKALRQSLISRYLMDEAGFGNGDISKASWAKRQEFLLNRYLDATRRADFLESLEKSGSRTGGSNQ